MRKKAEEAFRVLRTETDQHITAIQQKLKGDYGSEVARLKSENAELRARLSARESEAEGDKVKSKYEKSIQEKTRQFESQLQSVMHEYDGRIDKLEQVIANAELQAKSEMESIERKHRRETGIRESRISRLETEITDLQSLIKQLEVDVSSARSVTDRVQSECDAKIREISREKEAATLELNRANSRLSSFDLDKRDVSIEKARSDLAYRKRIGEMESEVRRSEIESVRLRKQIVALNQRIESLEAGAPKLSAVRSILDDGAMRASMVGIFAIDGNRMNSGRITRLRQSLPPAQVEEVDSPRFH